MKLRVALFGAALAATAWVLGPVTAEAQIDHYQCYKLKDLKNPQFAQLKVKDGNGVQLIDQFGVFLADIKKVRKFCTPLSKDGGSVAFPSVHYCEYQVKGIKFAVRPQIEVSSQFQTSQLELKKAFTILVPCDKTII